MSLPVLRRRETLENDQEFEGSWAISYGDMLTLLLAFFILFSSINKRDQEQGALKSALLTTLAPLQKARPILEAYPNLTPLSTLEISFPKLVLLVT